MKETFCSGVSSTLQYATVGSEDDLLASLSLCLGCWVGFWFILMSEEENPLYFGFCPVAIFSHCVNAHGLLCFIFPPEVMLQTGLPWMVNLLKAKAWHCPQNWDEESRDK